MSTRRHTLEHRRRRAVVAGMFSLDLRPRTTPCECAEANAARIDAALVPGGVALVTGPSGSGKSSVLRALEARLRSRSVRVVRVRPIASLARERREVINMLSGPIESDLRLLGSVGLAEAPLWIRQVRRLSDGELARLAIALAFRRAGRTPSTIIADEFGSLLDRPCARGIALGLRRALGPRHRIVLATPHDDTRGWLQPDILCDLAGTARETAP